MPTLSNIARPAPLTFPESLPNLVSFGSIVAALLAACFLLLAGCGEPSAAPVDPARAQEALKLTLESWKNGDSIEALKTAKPAIVAQDLDWLGGARLVDYSVSDETRKVAANLSVPVRLTLRTSSGKEVKKNVTYVVGTDPYLTVFRDLR